MSLKRVEKKLPDPIANAPELFTWLSPYYTAFEELSADRPYDGMSGSVGYIPWVSIDAYCRRHPFLGDDFETTLTYLRCLDVKYLALVEEAKPKPPPKGPKQGGKSPRK